MDEQSSRAHSQLPLPRNASTSTSTGLRRLSSITAFTNPFNAFNARRERKASGGTPATLSPRNTTPLHKLGLASAVQLDSNSTTVLATPARPGRLPKSKTTSVLPSLFTKPSASRPPSRIPVPTASGSYHERTPALEREKTRSSRKHSEGSQGTQAAGKINTTPILSDSTNRLPDPSTPASRRPPRHSISSGHQIKQHGLLKPVEPDPQPPGAFPQTPLSSFSGIAAHFSNRTKPKAPLPLSARRQSEISSPYHTPSRASLRFIQEVGDCTQHLQSATNDCAHYKVSQAQPDGYWAGRFTSIRDQTLNRVFDCGAELPVKADTGTFEAVAAMKTTAEAQFVFDILYGFCVTDEARASLMAFQLQFANNNHLPDLAYHMPQPVLAGNKAKADSEDPAPFTTTSGSAKIGSFVSRFKGGLRKSSGSKALKESKDVYVNPRLV